MNAQSPDAALEAVLDQLPANAREAVLEVRNCYRQRIAALEAECASYRKALTDWAKTLYSREELEQLAEQAVTAKDGMTLDQFLPQLENACLRGMR